MLTLQEIFDKVVTGLLKQGECARSRLTCQYRLEKVDGKVIKCAVGQLISDETYRPEIEGSTLIICKNSVLSKKAQLLKGILLENGVDIGDKPTLNFLVSAQDIHDFTSVENWKEKYRKLGEEYNLNTEVCDG